MSGRLFDLQAQWATDLGLGGNPVASFGAPVSFTAHLDSILPGATAVLSTSGLANGYRTPYVIDEIRMQGYQKTASATTLTPAYALQFQFRTGAYAFSKAPVPMLLYAPFYMAPPSNATNLVPGVSLSSTFTGGLLRIGHDSRWLLPKPLWMGPGDQIQCNLQRLLTPMSLGNGAFSVDVTYVGRSLKPGTPGPRKRYVPWVSSFVHDFANSYSETTEEFRNPFTVPLQVQRLVGHPMSKSTSAVTNFDLATTRVLMQQGTPAAPNHSSEWVTMYIEDSLGYKITNGYIDAASIFDGERGAWTFQRPLGPRDQLNMKFVTNGNQNDGAVFGVGMHAYREETGL